MADPSRRGLLSKSMISAKRDYASEVAKRRALLEKEKEERRAAAKKDQEEKLARAAAQKEKLLQRHREEQEKELQRAAAVQARRAAALVAERAKKEALLAKSDSPPVKKDNSNGSKQQFAFGSRTPRDFGYLTQLTKQQKIYNHKLHPTNGPEKTPTQPSFGRLSTGSSMSRSLYITRSEGHIRPKLATSALTQSVMMTPKIDSAHHTSANPRAVGKQQPFPIRRSMPQGLRSDVDSKLHTTPKSTNDRHAGRVLKPTKMNEGNHKATKIADFTKKVEEEFSTIGKDESGNSKVMVTVRKESDSITAAAAENGEPESFKTAATEGTQAVNSVAKVKESAEINEKPVKNETAEHGMVKDEVKADESSENGIGPVHVQDKGDGEKELESVAESKKEDDVATPEMKFESILESAKEDSVAAAGKNREGESESREEGVATNAENGWLFRTEDLKHVRVLDSEDQSQISLPADKETRNNFTVDSMAEKKQTKSDKEQEAEAKQRAFEQEQREREERRAKLLAIMSRTRGAPTAVVTPTKQSIIREVDHSEPLKVVERTSLLGDDNISTPVLSQTTTNVLQKLASSNPRLLSVLQKNGSNPSLVDQPTAADSSMTLPGQPDEPYLTSNFGKNGT